MASNFIPMLSASPPPIDDCPDNEDDDEEFGNFTSANIDFDSSFDSPVDKFKSFQLGDNGVKDITINTSSQNLKLNYQSNHVNYSNQNQSEDRNLSGIEKLSKHSSGEEIKNDGTLTSQNGFSESMNNDAQGDCFNSFNNRFKLKESEQNVLNLDHLSVNHSDGDISVSKSVPLFSNEFRSSESKNIPNSEISNNCQSNNIGDLELPESVNSVNSLESSIEPCNHDRNALDDCVDSAPSDLNIEFPVDFLENDSFDEFKTAGFVNGSNIDGDVLLNDHGDGGNVEDKESSESEFDDFQAGKIDPASFTIFQTEKENLSDYSDFQSEKAEICNFNNIPGEKDDFSNFKVSVEESPNFDEDDKGHHSDSNEFDDFQAFDTSRLSKFEFNDSKKINETDVIEDKEMKDFADFQTCSEATIEQGFADFESVSVEEDVDPSSPEFADFKTASFSSVGGDMFPNSSPSAHTQVKNDKLSTVINTIFPLQEVSSDIDLLCDLAPEVLEQSNKSLRLWEKLNEVEPTPNMRLQWGVSHTFQQLLRSVNVDYHSILRTSSVPIFASGLSLLEPLKGLASAANPDSEDRIQSPRDPIPPVQFDWNTSGLTNPLDSVQAISTLMDLSFLSPSETKTSSFVGGDSFENELLKPSPVPSSTESNKNFILEELLSKNVCSLPNSNITHRPPNLSQEANSVLDHLPDLSFIRAKVLMFPIISHKT